METSARDALIVELIPTGQEIEIDVVRAALLIPAIEALLAEGVEFDDQEAIEELLEGCRAVVAAAALGTADA